MNKLLFLFGYILIIAVPYVSYAEKETINERLIRVEE